MTTHLLLISHAPTSATRAASFPADEALDPPIAALPELRAEIEKIGRFDSILLGPEKRVAETATALGIGSEGVVNPALRDCDYGRWAGRRLRELEKEEPAALIEWMTNPEANPHGGGSIVKLLHRVATWLDEHSR
jgi:broad specificity phosphatase PhoE